MKTTWTTWLMAGALIASLQWSLFGTRPDSPAPEACAALDCSIDVEALGLTAEQTRALEALCRADCAQASRLELEARAALGALYTELAQPDVDGAELRARATEVSALRERSLQALVDAVLEVREVLAPEQVESLLAACCLMPISDPEGMDR